MVIDRLREEIVRLKARLRHQERTAKEGPFGSSTPSAKIPLKANTPPESSQRRGGAKPGHRGRNGRRFTSPATRSPASNQCRGCSRCPHCGGPLDPKGSKARTIIEVDPVRKEVVRYELEQCDCHHCHRTFTARPTGVFAKGLFGNRLLTHLWPWSIIYTGVTLGRLSACLGDHPGQLVERLCISWPGAWPACPSASLLEYRRAPVKHADENRLCTDGRKMDTPGSFPRRSSACFVFARAARPAWPQAVFGTKRLRGNLGGRGSLQRLQSSALFDSIFATRTCCAGFKIWPRNFQR